MKKSLVLLSILAGISMLSSSCHQSYACTCEVKDSVATMTTYHISANSESAATAQCNGIRSQHANDTCWVQIFK